MRHSLPSLTKNCFKKLMKMAPCTMVKKLMEEDMDMANSSTQMAVIMRVNGILDVWRVLVHSITPLEG